MFVVKENIKEAVVITNAGLARQLLQSGETMIDIKPHRQIKNATVFVFKSTNAIREEIERRLNKNK